MVNWLRCSKIESALLGLLLLLAIAVLMQTNLKSVWAAANQAPSSSSSSRRSNSVYAGTGRIQHHYEEKSWGWVWWATVETWGNYQPPYANGGSPHVSSTVSAWQTQGGVPCQGSASTASSTGWGYAKATSTKKSVTICGSQHGGSHKYHAFGLHSVGSGSNKLTWSRTEVD